MINAVDPKVDTCQLYDCNDPDPGYSRCLEDVDYVASRSNRRTGQVTRIRVCARHARDPSRLQGYTIAKKVTS